MQHLMVYAATRGLNKEQVKSTKDSWLVKVQLDISGDEEAQGGFDEVCDDE